MNKSALCFESGISNLCLFCLWRSGFEVQNDTLLLVCQSARCLRPVLCAFVLIWRGVWWGHCFVLGVKEGGPMTPPCLFTLFLCSACWVKERNEAQEAVAQWWGTPQLHTCTHRVSSVLLWNRKHSWLHKGPFHQSSYRIWQPLQSLLLPVPSVIPSFSLPSSFPVFLPFSTLHKSIVDPSYFRATSKHPGSINLELDYQIFFFF